MLRVQVLLLASLLAAGEPLIGEAGLTELAASGASVLLVAGEGTRTVQRADEPDEPGDPRQVRFAVATDGRYDIVLTDPADPGGERNRFVSDGRTAWEVSLMAAGEKPLVKQRPATGDLTARLLACLRLDLSQLRRDYAVELVAAGEGRRELRLVPNDPGVTREIARIVISIDGAGRPSRLVLDEPSGNRHRLVIAAFRDDPPAEPGWFSGP
jgi:hypothetical protein